MYPRHAQEDGNDRDASKGHINNSVDGMAYRPPPVTVHSVHRMQDAALQMRWRSSKKKKKRTAEFAALHANFFPQMLPIL